VANFSYTTEQFDLLHAMNVANMRYHRGAIIDAIERVVKSKAANLSTQIPK
jgi:hypothetical protein